MENNNFRKLRDVVLDSDRPLIQDICTCRISQDGKSGEQFAFLDRFNRKITVTIDRGLLFIEHQSNWLFSNKEFPDFSQLQSQFAKLIQ